MKPDEKETLRILFRLDAAVNDLREEGKYPFTDDPVALEINEDDLGSFCEKIESTDDYTVSEWHKLFVEEGYIYSTIAPEPEFSLSTLWGIISKVRDRWVASNTEMGTMGKVPNGNGYHGDSP